MTNAECPCCHRERFLTSIDILEDMPAPLVALFRGDDILMVGKINPEVLKEFCKPGDKIVDETGRVGTYRPPTETPSSSSSEPAPEVPVPQVPFTGKAHKL